MLRVYLVCLLSLCTVSAFATFEVPQPPQVVAKTGFERGESYRSVKEYRLTEEAHTGRYALTSTITEDGEARSITIPFTALSGQTISVSCWVKADADTSTFLLAKVGNAERRPIGGIPKTPRQWTQVSGQFEVWGGEGSKVKCEAIIGAPVAHNSEPGTAWVDDIEITVVPNMASHPGQVPEERPALTVDGSGTLWMATLREPLPRQTIRVKSITANGTTVVADLDVPESTALGRPAIDGASSGCVVTFAAEVDGQWRIAYATVTSEGATPLQFIDFSGTNINPDVAVAGDTTWIVWQSNARGRQCIHALNVNKRGRPGSISLLSDWGENNRNPSIVALNDATLFAAWDSVRNRQSDIYGAWFRDDAWNKEIQVSDSPYLERRPQLTRYAGQLWMVWEAQTFLEHFVNNVTVQCFVVARMGKNGPEVPTGFFDRVSIPGALYRRPQIAFDSAGRLWVTARRSTGAHSGWNVVSWCYSGEQWTSPRSVWDQEGRWFSAPLAPLKSTMLAAVQRDIYPRMKDVWESEVILVPFPVKWIPDVVSRVPAEDYAMIELPPGGQVAELVTEPLAMPETEFRLANLFEEGASDFPRKTVMHGPNVYNVYWGDLHEHSAISQCGRSVQAAPYDLMANQQDIEKFDFTALTDHGYNQNDYVWQFTQEITRASHDPGRFVTFLAEEWTSSMWEYEPPREYRRYGHRNIIYLDPYYGHWYNAAAKDVSPRELWDEIGDEPFIAIPHQLADTGNCPTDWDYVDDKLQPLAEIYQQRGSYEYEGCPDQAQRTVSGHFIQDAWAQGVTIGVIASPDHGGGKARAGVWAPELTREALFKAMQQRHTFGMTKPKMALWVASSKAMLGDVVKDRKEGPIPLKIRAWTPRRIKELVIWRNNEIVYRDEPNATEVKLEWVDQEPLDAPRVWYYVRLQCEDDAQAWSSPIWFVKE